MSKNDTKQQNRNNWAFTIIALAGFLLWWLFKQNRKKDQVIHELRNEKDDMSNELNEINDIIDQSLDLTAEVKVKIRKLINEKQVIEESVRSELLQAFILIQVQLSSKALLCLAKIIENSLKVIFANDTTYTQKYKANRFVDLLNHAKDTGVLDRDEFHYANGIRELRNQEAHTLNVERDDSWNVSSLLVATSIIIKLEEKKPKGLWAGLHTLSLES